jgi:simple sugar transport system permease protein
LTGGRGTILGIFIGACLMYTVEDVLLLLRAPGFYLDMFVGAILVGAVVVNSWLARR